MPADVHKRLGRHVATVAASGALLVGGFAVFGSGGGPTAHGSGQASAASSQYCPPSSQKPGKPKKPGPAACGKANGPKQK